MAVHVATRQSMTRGQPQTLQSTVLPAPIGGMDGRLNLASNNLNNCVYAYNLVPSEYGMRTRRGYREWQIDVETAPGLGLGIRTIIPWHAPEADQANDKLFVVTNEGIWDVTLYNGVPALVQAFGITTGEAGWANFITYTDAAGTIQMFVTDEANGVFVYDTVLDTWSVPAITGVAPADLVHVVSHKQRIWFTERDSTTGWYLPVGASSGAATPFYFGSKFPRGGDLVGLYNWSLDSGEGVDDFLVAVSRAGDVIPWAGSDPSLAVGWRTAGTFYIGDVPIGRRVADEYGGDLHILSDIGLSAMSDLLRGENLTAEASELTQRMSRFIREDMTQYGQKYGWELRVNPSEGVMLIGSPVRENGVYLQYRVNTSVEGWAWWRGVPHLTGAPWHEAYMVGTVDNRVLRMDVNLDNELLDGTEGDPIEFSMLTNFVDLGQPAVFKWGEFMRPNWLSRQVMGYTTKFLYDFNTAELSAGDALANPPKGLWDFSNWDEVFWGSARNRPYFSLTGGWGPGRTVAVAMRGQAYDRATLASIDVMWRAGGPF